MRKSGHFSRFGFCFFIKLTGSSQFYKPIRYDHFNWSKSVKNYCEIRSKVERSVHVETLVQQETVEHGKGWDYVQAGCVQTSERQARPEANSNPIRLPIHVVLSRQYSPLVVGISPQTRILFG